MSSREAVEAAVAAVEEQQAPSQVLPDQVVPDPQKQPQESQEAQPDERPGRTAGRPRDEKGRLLPGKPVKEAAPEPQETSTTSLPQADAAPVAAPEPQKQAIPRPKSLKAAFQSDWEKLAAENPAFANHLTERERQFTSGVTTYKQEFERVQPLAQALQPYEPMLKQEGIDAPQFVAAMAGAHRILKYGSDQERLQAGLKLIADYRIPVLEYLQQGGQLQAMRPGQQMQYPQYQQQPTQDLDSLVEQKITEREMRSELQQFVSAADADGNPLYPHYEEVKLDMAQILEAGRAPDLKSAYQKAIRMNDELWQQEQERARAVSEQARLQAQAKTVAKAKANAVSVKSATPTGAITGEKPKDRRSSAADVAAAYEQHVGQGGRV